MTVIGVTMVKDEIDVIEPVMNRMLAQVDAILVADNGSTDGTREVLEGLPVEFVDDPDPAHFQSRKMTKLALKARDLGAEWVVAFDADEVWVPESGTVVDVLSRLPPEAMVCEAMLYQHVSTGRDNGGDPFHRMGWREAAAKPLRKVACRPRDGFAIDEGNHWVNYAGQRADSYPLSVTRGLEVRHFPYRDPEQFIRKVRNGAAALALTDLPFDVGAHWRSYGKVLDRLGEDGLRDHFRDNFFYPDPESADLVYDPCP